MKLSKVEFHQNCTAPGIYGSHVEAKKHNATIELCEDFFIRIHMHKRTGEPPIVVPMTSVAWFHEVQESVETTAHSDAPVTTQEAPKRGRPRGAAGVARGAEASA